MSTQPEVLQFEIVRHITLPFFKMPEDGTPAYVRFNSAFEPDKTSFSDRVRRVRKDASEKEESKPMDIATITNLQTGEEMRLVAHQVLKQTMDESFKDASYVGKSFRIVKSERKGGRGGKYFAFDVAEIRIKTTEQPTQQQSAPPAQQPGPQPVRPNARTR